MTKVKLSQIKELQNAIDKLTSIEILDTSSEKMVDLSDESVELMINIIQNIGFKNQGKPVICEKCGYEVSPYYFSSIKDINGKSYDAKCQNCGHFMDPE